MEKCNKMPDAEREAEGKNIKWREGREGGVRWGDITAGGHRPLLHCRYQNKTRQGGGGGIEKKRIKQEEERKKGGDDSSERKTTAHVQLVPSQRVPADTHEAERVT